MKTIPVWFIAQEIELSIKSTSKHLLLLSQAHLVRSSRKKIEMHYSLPQTNTHYIKNFSQGIPIKTKPATNQ
jgi:predicted transcriptional regulator